MISNQFLMLLKFWKSYDFDRYDKNSSITVDHTNRKIVIDVHISLYGYEDSNGRKNNHYVYISNENIDFVLKIFQIQIDN